MDKLWIRTICGDIEDVGIMSLRIGDAAPGWMLHGMTWVSGPNQEDEPEVTYIAIWGEMEFIRDCDLESGVSWCDIQLSEEDMEKVLEAAARQAMRIALEHADLSIYGEALLKKHSDARQANNTMEAYLNAALMERKASYTEEDYQEY